MKTADICGSARRISYSQFPKLDRSCRRSRDRSIDSSTPDRLEEPTRKSRILLLHAVRNSRNRGVLWRATWRAEERIVTLGLPSEKLEILHCLASATFWDMSLCAVSKWIVCVPSLGKYIIASRRCF